MPRRPRWRRRNPGGSWCIPFENTSRAPRVYWLSEGSAVLLTDNLQALGMPAISRDDRQRAFEHLRVPAVASLSHATVIRLGQVVGAAQVVVGSFELKSDELIVRARAIRLDTGRISPEIVSRGRLTDIFGIYAGIARRLVLQHVRHVRADGAGAPAAAGIRAIRQGPDR